ncbi:hypothetical protein EVJ58_g11109, partial [Rhodofomes roseus]
MKAVPDETVDVTEQGHFVRPWAMNEVEDAKAHIREHSLKSATGIDKVAYERVLRIPNEELLHLFQACVDSRDAPTTWLTASLIGIGKRGKDLGDPTNYRAVGLESCMLKMLTLMIERRIRNWAESTGKLPMSQNGFREGHRTNNNAFVLRTAIEKARANGKPLYVAFVDLSNAFPSVDQPTMWAKLYDAGCRGPLFDWLRMLYSRLEYVVRSGGDVSERFRALAGILIGDPASPILWNLFLADLVIRTSPDDVVLAGVAVSHLEQADDIAIFTTSVRALQEKLDDLAAWCAVNFAFINTTKTQVMVFGNASEPPRVYINRRLLSVVDSYVYVGIQFASSSRDVFAPHTEGRASAARRVANACLSIESYVGPLPPWAALTLYQSHVDPYVTAGCEVALDSKVSSATQLEAVQLAYLRRVLGLNPRSVKVVMFSETGLWPMRYRRLALALRYLQYVLGQRPALPLAALAEARALALSGKASWLGDLRLALSKLTTPVVFDVAAPLTEDGVAGCLEDLRTSLVTDLKQQINGSTRLTILSARKQRDPALERRAYLAVTNR